MILMLQMVIPSLERFVLFIIMQISYFDKNIKFIIEKNLEGHQKRNQKTSIMFMIALSFIIFAGCSTQLIINFIVNVSKNAFGSDINVYSNTLDSLDEIGLTNYLRNFSTRFPNSIKNFSFITFPLKDIINRNTYFSTLCQFPRLKVDVVAVSRGLIQSTNTDIYYYKELNDKMQFDLSNNKFLLS